MGFEELLRSLSEPGVANAAVLGGAAWASVSLLINLFNWQNVDSLRKMWLAIAIGFVYAMISHALAISAGYVPDSGLDGYGTAFMAVVGAAQFIFAGSRGLEAIADARKHKVELESPVVVPAVKRNEE